MSRVFLSLALVVVLLAVAAAPSVDGRDGESPLKLEMKASVPTFELVRIKVKGCPADSPITYRITPKDGVDLLEVRHGEAVFVAPPGRYEVEVFAVDRRGLHASRCSWQRSWAPPGDDAACAAGRTQDGPWPRPVPR